MGDRRYKFGPSATTPMEFIRFGGVDVAKSFNCNLTLIWFGDTHRPNPMNANSGYRCVSRDAAWDLSRGVDGGREVEQWGTILTSLLRTDPPTPGMQNQVGFR